MLLRLVIEFRSILRMFTNVNKLGFEIWADRIIISISLERSYAHPLRVVESHRSTSVDNEAKPLIKTLLMSGSEIDFFDSLHTGMCEDSFN